MNFVYAFAVGGILCVTAQLLCDLTDMTPAHVLVCYVVLGVALNGLGIYPRLIEIAGAGATVPITGFGNCLADGVRQAVDESGLIGVFTGGLTATAGGITVAVTLAFILSLIFKPKDK